MKTESVVTARCRQCKWSFKIPAGDKQYVCDYLGKTGELRGCAAGDSCTRYMSKRKKGKK